MRRLRLWFLEPHETLIGIRSIRARWTRDGIEWPTMLVERHGHRVTVTPVWNWAHLTAPWKR